MELFKTPRFHTSNATRPSETVPPGSCLDDDLYARPSLDSRTPRGWLVDMLNKYVSVLSKFDLCIFRFVIVLTGEHIGVIFRFGEYGGFRKLLERFQSDKPLTVPVVFTLIKPFGLCYDLLTVHTIVTYFVPVVVSRFILFIDCD